MTTSATPNANKGNTVATTSKDNDSTKAGLKESDQAHQDVPRGALAPAGQSGDPAIQKLLADREGHRMNLEPDPDLSERRNAAQKAIDEIDKKLEKLGYTAK